MEGADRKIETWPIDRLTPYARNARTHSAAQIDALADSFRQFGWTLPLLVREDGTLIAGHGRVLAARKIGATDAPVIVARGWSEAQCRAYTIADNKLAEQSGWDQTLLQLELGELQGLGFDSGTMGFAAGELATMLGLSAPQVAAPSLADRFMIPPFSVLNAREGWWQDRKRAWIAIGIRSELGREGTVYNATQLQIDAGKTQAINGRAGGAAPGGSKRLSGYSESGERETGLVTDSDVSIFDPVMCEIAYRWFCPPAGLVLDPFAGGSVRGIVAGILGRNYIGVDLSGSQIEANCSQAVRIFAPQGPPAAGLPADFMPEFTPVDAIGPYFAKREDQWRYRGVAGAKSRTMFRLAEAQKSAGIISAGARGSPQIERAALVAKALGIPSRIHTGAGSETAEIRTCLDAGADVLQHNPARLSVIRARFNADVAAHADYFAAPFGLGLEAYASDVAAQVANIPPGVQRLVVPCGSGMTLAAILRGVQALRPGLPVLAVRLGAQPVEYLQKFAPRGWEALVSFVDSGMPFEDHAPIDWQPDPKAAALRLDPMYEAKCVPFLQPGDCLWCVGLRESAQPAAPPATAAIAPSWHCGDSRNIAAIVGEIRADFLFTCPPYGDLEVYSDHPADISAMAYADFLAAFRQIIAGAAQLLREDRFAAVVVGEFRDKRGAYRNFVGDTVQAFRDAGLDYYNEAILVTAVGSLPLRAAEGFAKSRKLGKTHQNLLVFCKGDPRAAAAACGTVQVADALALMAAAAGESAQGTET